MRTRQGRIRLYDPRHTGPLWSSAHAVPPKVVSEQLGHASVAFTLDTYSHPAQTPSSVAASRAKILPTSGAYQALVANRCACGVFRQTSLKYAAFRGGALESSSEWVWNRFWVQGDGRFQGSMHTRIC